MGVTNYITTYIGFDEERNIKEFKTFGSTEKLFKWMKPSYDEAALIKQTFSTNKKTGLNKDVYYGEGFEIRKTGWIR